MTENGSPDSPTDRHQLTRVLHQAAILRRDDTAIVHAHRRLTNQDLMRRVARLAGRLASYGIQHGDRVAILGANSDRYIEILFAVLWRGGVVVPLNTRWTQEEISNALSTSQSKVLFTDDTQERDIAGLTQSVASLEVVLPMKDGPELPAYDSLFSSCEPIDDAGAGGDDVALIIYTGGTTGSPKGVMLSHNNLMSAALGMIAAGCGSGNTYLHAPPLFHIAGIQQMLAHFIEGTGPQVILEKFTPEEIVTAVERYAVTDVMFVPTMLRAVLDYVRDSGRTNALQSLERVFYGAAPMPSSLLNEASETIPRVGFVQGYGMTETALTVMLPPFYYTAEGRKQGKTQSVGRPLPHAQIVIRDHAGQPVPHTQPGEITVKGKSVMVGYVGMPELTRATVSPDGWLKTGDIGYKDEDGFIFLVGRLKDMVITGGENVYASEVEEVLTRHPSVAMAAVIGVPDDYWGERVHAVVTMNSADTLTEGELISFCRKQLAKYKCPRSITFVESLPTSPAGKILKGRLRESFQTRADL